MVILPTFQSRRRPDPVIPPLGGTRVKIVIWETIKAAPVPGILPGARLEMI
jgi:hypothetical protein